MKHYIVIYLATLVVMVAIDMAWLGFVARDFYQSRIGSLLEFHAIPAVLFYVLYAAGIVVFVNGAAVDNWQTVLVYGALFGFFAYMTYDLSNLATLRNWSTSLVVVDIIWGSIATAIAATAGWFITGFFER